MNVSQNQWIRKVPVFASALEIFSNRLGKARLLPEAVTVADRFHVIRLVDIRF